MNSVIEILRTSDVFDILVEYGKWVLENKDKEAEDTRDTNSRGEED
jgi:hypothetical protein